MDRERVLPRFLSPDKYYQFRWIPSLVPVVPLVPAQSTVADSVFLKIPILSFVGKKSCLKFEDIHMNFKMFHIFCAPAKK